MQEERGTEELMESEHKHYQDFEKSNQVDTCLKKKECENVFVCACVCV